MLLPSNFSAEKKLQGSKFVGMIHLWMDHPNDGQSRFKSGSRTGSKSNATASNNSTRMSKSSRSTSVANVESQKAHRARELFGLKGRSKSITTHKYCPESDDVHNTSRTTLDLPKVRIFEKSLLSQYFYI